MNLLKKSILVALLTLPFIAYGQRITSLRGGVGLSLSKIKVPDEHPLSSVDVKRKAGIIVGVSTDIKFDNFGEFVEERMSLSPGFQVITKGYRSSSTVAGVTYKSKTNISYISLPVNVYFNVYDFTIANLDIATGVYLGYYFAAGVGGKVKSTVNFLGEENTETDKLKFGNDENEDDIKRLDSGLSGGVRLDFDTSFTFELGFQTGLTNISPASDDAFKTKNRTIGASLYYNFYF